MVVQPSHCTRVVLGYSRTLSLRYSPVLLRSALGDRYRESISIDSETVRDFNVWLEGARRGAYTDRTAECRWTFGGLDRIDFCSEQLIIDTVFGRTGGIPSSMSVQDMDLSAGITMVNVNRRSGTDSLVAAAVW